MNAYRVTSTHGMIFVVMAGNKREAIAKGNDILSAESFYAGCEIWQVESV